MHLVLVERSLYYDRRVFVRYLANLGVLSEEDLAAHDEMVGALNPVLYSPDVCLFVRADAERCVERMRQRAKTISQSAHKKDDVGDANPQGEAIVRQDAHKTGEESA